MQDVKQPVRVLHVLGALNRGGAETMVMNLYRHVDRDQVQFDFMIHTEEKCDYEDEIRALGGRIHRICRFRGINTVSYVRAWKRFFEEHREYRIVHGHMRSTASIYLSVAKKYGVFTIAHSHNASSGKGVQAAVKNMLQLPLRWVADLYFACSESAGEWLFGKKVVSGEKFMILKNAIDVEGYVFDPGIREKKRKELCVEDAIVIGHIGRFHEQKNHRFLLEVFEELHKEDPRFKLLLVGTGELKQEMEQTVAAKNLQEYVEFLGMRTDVEELLEAMDIFVFPSLYEGLGIVVIEAQASGLPVVCSDRIPDDVKLTELVTYAPLGDHALWKDIILDRLKNTNADRTVFSESIKRNGYDIYETAEQMQNFYIGAFQRIARKEAGRC